MTAFVIDGQHVIHFKSLPVKTGTLLDVLMAAHTGIAAMRSQAHGDGLLIADELAESLVEFTAALKTHAESKELDGIIQAIQLSADSLHAEFKNPELKIVKGDAK